ncbi:hypothetical protein D7O18_25860 [Salmonella enterica subsp. enterica serovar Muenchen]|nr:hypothetical protein [Salmonella enterica subsp. enterica serovar Muenchen]
MLNYISGADTLKYCGYIQPLPGIINGLRCISSLKRVPNKRSRSNLLVDGFQHHNHCTLNKRRQTQWASLTII